MGIVVGVGGGEGVGGKPRVAEDGENEEEPEAAVGGEGGGSERIVFLPFENAGDDLGHAAEEDAHAEDEGVEAEEAGVVEVEEYGGHAEGEKAEGRGVAGGVLNADGRRSLCHVCSSDLRKRSMKCGVSCIAGKGRGQWMGRGGTPGNYSLAASATKSPRRPR